MNKKSSRQLIAADKDSNVPAQSASTLPPTCDAHSRMVGLLLANTPSKDESLQISWNILIGHLLFHATKTIAEFKKHMP
jgi:hypothetical protein